jgi:hypothetical protein
LNAVFECLPLAAVVQESTLKVVHTHTHTRSRSLTCSLAHTRTVPVYSLTRYKLIDTHTHLFRGFTLAIATRSTRSLAHTRKPAHLHTHLNTYTPRHLQTYSPTHTPKHLHTETPTNLLTYTHSLFAHSLGLCSYLCLSCSVVTGEFHGTEVLLFFALQTFCFFFTPRLLVFSSLALRYSAIAA